MKATKALTKLAAPIAALILGSSAWLSAQTNKGLIGQPEGGRSPPHEKKTANSSTNNQTSQLMRINRSSSLIGNTVKNQKGETLGKIRDLVIDFNSDRVGYVVLDSDMRRPHPGMNAEPTEVMARPAHGKGSIVPLALYPPGFDLSSLLVYDPAVSRWVQGGSSGTELVSSHQLHAVPLRALQPDVAGTSLILNADKDNLARSEGFDKDHWPAVTTAAWGAEPFWKDPQRPPDSREEHQVYPQNTKELQSKEHTDPTIELKKIEGSHPHRVNTP